MITRKRLNYLIKDEAKATKEYRKLGFLGLSRDEARHRQFLIKKLKTIRRLTK